MSVDRIREASQEATQAMVKLYETIKGEAEESKFFQVLIDVPAADAKERFQSLAREWRDAARRLESEGLPADLKLVPGKVYGRGGVDLTEDECTAANAEAVKEASTALNRRAEALEWMADRVATGATFRLSESEVMRLWEGPPNLSSQMRGGLIGRGLG